MKRLNNKLLDKVTTTRSGYWHTYSSGYFNSSLENANSASLVGFGCPLPSSVASLLLTQTAYFEFIAGSCLYNANVTRSGQFFSDIPTQTESVPSGNSNIYFTSRPSGKASEHGAGVRFCMNIRKVSREREILHSYVSSLAFTSKIFSNPICYPRLKQVVSGSRNIDTTAVFTTHTSLINLCCVGKNELDTCVKTLPAQTQAVNTKSALEQSINDKAYNHQLPAMHHNTDQYTPKAITRKKEVLKMPHRGLPGGKNL
ncbi:hypothetical protein [Chryseosolibacter indicus]|uniref:Uncharacterized protein n=1 Tax=Chryseosolibacter indicus TaxID=2782351 RepID=A0ABS5VSJ9_9BACT|nr:hypothetical protein [Chryseosolibacter indicus]MBT1703820.1 hypothetical protein [Chryseosolibacter indicus]